MEKAVGILLKKIPLTETSLIVVWCTAEHGLVRTAAKGARRPNSPFAGRLDLFYQAEFAYAKARSGDLHTLRELTVSDFRPHISSSYTRVLAASYFVKLIELVSITDTPIPEKYALLHRALDWLNTNEPTAKGVLHFERELASLLGIWSPGQMTTPFFVLQQAYHSLPEQRNSLFERLTGAPPSI